MKRVICLFTALFLCASLASCAYQKNDLNEPVTFYYCTDPEDYENTLRVIAGEQREADTFIGNTQGLLQLYLQGPESTELLSPFPDGVQLKKLGFDGTNVQLVLSSHFNSLMDMNMTIACACLSLTALELTGAQSVTIKTTNSYGAVQTVVTMTQDSILLLDAALPTD